MQKRFTPDAGGVFPEWEEIEFGKLFQRRSEKNGEEFGVDKTISVATMHFKPEGNKADEKSLPKYKVMRTGDIAFEGHINKHFKHGRFVLNDIGDGIISPIFEVLQPVSELSKEVPEFWKYYINYEPVMGKILAKCANTGIMMNRLAIKDFYKQKIKVPCIEEQRKIAAALAAYDEMIAVKTAKLETWQECKKRMVKEIFGRTKRFKDDGGSEFPDWEEKTLGDVCVRVTKRNKGCKSNLPLTISAKDGIVDQKTYFNKIVASKNLENYYIIEKGEFAYNKSYSAGFKYGSIKRLDDYEEGVLSPIYICFSISDTNIVDSDYLVQYFDSMKWNDQMSVLCNEGVRNHGAINVKTEDFFAIRIPLPCMEEQQKIGSFLAEIDKEIEIQKEFIKTYAEGKKRMMMELIR